MDMPSELTPHRQTVLDVIRASKDHPSARQIFLRSLKKDPGLSQATVYNSLNFLSQGGFIRKVGSDDEGVRYDGLLDRHDHLVCRQCGRIEDADLVGAFAPSRAPRLSNFQVEEISLRVSGLCRDCRKPQRITKTKE
jgi:Fe2+ or Zn2+ uptake regulation protein